MKKAFSVFLCFLLVAALAACSTGAGTESSSSQSDSSSEPAAPEVTLNKQRITLPVDGTYTLTATVEHGKKDAKVIWKSSSEKSVTVKDGLVTALKPGKFAVFATVEGSDKVSCIVTVRETPDTSATEDEPDGADTAQDGTGQDGTAQAATDAWQGQGQDGGGHTAPQGQPQAPAPAQPQAQAQHQPVWVVTQHAWTEQVPIYNNVERMICNNCGADFTGISPSAHAQSMPIEQQLAGCGSWHSVWIDTIVGYDEILHPEQGHWQ